MQNLFWWIHRILTTVRKRGGSRLRTSLSPSSVVPPSCSLRLQQQTHLHQQTSITQSETVLDQDSRRFTETVILQVHQPYTPKEPYYRNRTEGNSDSRRSLYPSIQRKDKVFKFEEGREIYPVTTQTGRRERRRGQDQESILGTLSHHKKKIPESLNHPSIPFTLSMRGEEGAGWVHMIKTPG